MNKKYEQRTIHFNRPRIVETRAGEPPTITGYAARFHDPNDDGTEYELYEGCRERILPGTFDRALRDKDDCRALFNHDPNQLLGRVSAGTLRLSVDAKGLRYDIRCPDTQVGRDVMESIRRGDVTGSSFGFIVRSEDWLKEDGERIRQIRDVELLDVSPVTYPAYTATTAKVSTPPAPTPRSASGSGRRLPDAITARLRVLTLDRVEEVERDLAAMRR